MGSCVAAGCSSSDEAIAEPPAAVTVAYDATWGLRFDPSAGELSVVRGADVLLRLPPAAFQLGTLDAPVDGATNYDPMGVIGRNALNPPPGDLVWRAPAAVRLVGADERSLSLALDYDGGFAATATATLEPGAGFGVTWAPTARPERIAWMRLGARAAADEGFYGLGESYEHVNLRGQTRAMQLEVDGHVESSLNDAHVPVPFLLGTRGWGLFVESRRPGVFQVATDDAAPELVDAVFGTGLGSAEGLRFHLFADGHPLDVTRHYYAITGAPLLPAPWALGPWLWRDENRDQAQVEGDVAKMRELDLAHTGIWIDRPYATAVHTFDWKASQFPDPAHMIDTIRANGLRWAVWHSPYLTEPGKGPPAEVAATAALRAEATEKGFYPPASGVLANKWGHLLDLTNPGAVAFWREKLEAYTAQPAFGGFKLDYGEDVVPGPFPARNAWEFANGEDEQTMHAGYSLAYHEAYAATVPEGGGFLLCRHGTYGDQKNVSVIWPGDMDASFAKRGDVIDGKAQVGGLPATVIAGLSLGPSGFPFFGADTGGYVHSPPDKELFTRWFEQTALSTVMQIGNSENTVAWELDPKTGFDEEMLGWYRTYTRLHLRLFPYIWSYAKKLAEDGRPIARALGLAHPELGVHPDDEYLFGDDLLVAPVVERGARSREVVFPNGAWTSWWTGETIEGPTTRTVDAPLDRLPLFVRDGGIVPMLRPTIDTLEPVDDPAAIDSFATTPGVLWVRIAPTSTRSSSFELYDGAAISSGGQVIELRDGSDFAHGTILEVVGVGEKVTPVLDTTPMTELASADELLTATSGFVWAADANGTMRVRVPAGHHNVDLGTLAR